MLQQILNGCALDPSDSLDQKSALFQTCLEAVLPLCNETSAAQDTKELLSEYINSAGEVPSYAPFVGAANRALLQLSALNVPGLVGPKDSEDHQNIIFHHNDKPVRQLHQGVESCRKPDVVIVSWDTARKAKTDGDLYCKQDLYTKLVCSKPDGNFQWKDVLSTIEFKYTKRRPGFCPPPPLHYNIASAPQNPHYMEYPFNKSQSPADSDSEPESDDKSPIKRPPIRRNTGSAQRESESDDELESPIKRPPIRRETGSAQRSNDLRGAFEQNKSQSPKEMGLNEPNRASQRTAPKRASERIKSQGKGEWTLKEPRRASDQNRSQGELKRNSDHLVLPESSNKRSKKDNGDPTKKDSVKSDPQTADAMIQNGLYVAEMFAAHVARSYVVSYIVVDDMIYMWRFDQEDTIQFAGINFIQDLPRFLVLLLALQRMQYTQWGFHPLFEPEPGFSGPVYVDDPKLGQVDLEFDFDSDDVCSSHFGLRGRATTVLPVKSQALSQLLGSCEHPNKPSAVDPPHTCPNHTCPNEPSAINPTPHTSCKASELGTDPPPPPPGPPPHNTSTDMVAKLYWPEESRLSEPEILVKVQAIAEHDSRVKGHVPDMVWFHKFDETSTTHIRKALEMNNAAEGSRVFYVIVFRRLEPITSLSDPEFRDAWWQIVVCHYILWKGGVYHRDISPSNLMFYRLPCGHVIGVLNDYDLSSIQDDCARGNERTGTVPFMSIDLLTLSGLDGAVEHMYWHDAESFVWVFVWVCLRYKNGKLRRKRRLPFDEWLKVDAPSCAMLKSHFLLVERRKYTRLRASASHQENWILAQAFLKLVCLCYVKEEELAGDFFDAENVFQTWLRGPIESMTTS